LETQNSRQKIIIIFHREFSTKTNHYLSSRIFYLSSRQKILLFILLKSFILNLLLKVISVTFIHFTFTFTFVFDFSMKLIFLTFYIFLSFTFVIDFSMKIKLLIFFIFITFVFDGLMKILIFIYFHFRFRFFN